MTILGSQAYVYQFKINAKAGFQGDVWQWHQDYVFWLKEDGLPTDRVTTAVLFLSDVTRFNAPLFLIPGSHKGGVIDVDAREQPLKGSQGKGPAWLSNLTADLKYALDADVITRLVQRHGMFSAEGPSGSLLFFHSNLVHGSTNNISPLDRMLVLISYNSVENLPLRVKNPRPEFLVSRKYDPITPLKDDFRLT
jgi:ectoine hydroxylase